MINMLTASVEKGKICMFNFNNLNTYVERIPSNYAVEVTNRFKGLDLMSIRQRRKGKICPFEYRVPKKSKER